MEINQFIHYFWIVVTIIYTTESELYLDLSRISCKRGETPRSGYEFCVLFGLGEERSLKEEPWPSCAEWRGS